MNSCKFMCAAVLCAAASCTPLAYRDPASSTSGPRLDIRNGALHLAEDGNAQVARTVAEATQLLCSVRGDAVCLAYYSVNGEFLALNVVRCSRTGVVREHHRLDRTTLTIPFRLDTLTWLDDDRVFVEGGINPSLGVGIEVALSSGQREVFYGHTFTWNSDASHVAFVRDPPHFGSPAGVPSEVWIDDQIVATIPSQRRATLTWTSSAIVEATVLELDGSVTVVRRIVLRGADWGQIFINQ